MNIDISVVNWETMHTIFTLIKDCWSFVCTSGLHCIIFKFWVFAVWALLFNSHFCFTTFFLLIICWDILPDPVPIFVYFHMSFNRFSKKFLKAEFFLASWASDLIEKSVKIDEAATFGTKIWLIILYCWHWVLYIILA